VIKNLATESSRGGRLPWCHQGAPNVLLIMTDDQGYGVSGAFGGVIPTPALDRVAKAGPLHPVQLHRAVLADPGGTDHRT
jgi:hypothetical protein